MKKSTVLCAFLLAIMAISGCEDWGLQGPQVYVFTINGTLNNTAETLHIGDTLRLEVIMPDTIRSRNKLGDTRTDVVSSIQYAPSYGYNLFQVDTVNNTVYYLQDEALYCSLYVSPGIVYPSNTHAPFIQTGINPARSVLHIIPKRKGIFYLEIIKFDALFKINNNFEGKANVNIVAKDKHFTLVSPYLGNDWLQYMMLRDTEGYGTYAFRVD